MYRYVCSIMNYYTHVTCRNYNIYDNSTSVSEVCSSNPEAVQHVAGLISEYRIQ